MTAAMSQASPRFLLLVLLLSVSAVAQDAAAPIRPEVPCYAPDGVTMADDSYRPCNNLGVLTDAGMFTSCYDEENGSFNGSATLTSCPDGKFCCGSNAGDCCGSSRAFTIPLAASLTRPTVTETVEAVRIQPMTPFYVWIAMGASILFVMLIALGAMLFLLRRVQRLKKRNEDLMEAAVVRVSKAPVLPRTPHVASMQEFQEFNSIYAELLAQREKQEQKDREKDKQREQDIERRRKMSMSIRSETDTMYGRVAQFEE
ncbi:unnamed protein product [Parascedosporium putredinis]|uniref:Uncharacterized protein n=1 Tax=Parascedosporium putredinis TaxID=1442378 RepID=A0A9P1M9F0_9PEZI|nr:unnamed protein product [Parascedosporium putredinis]CAI7994715.1 unnamed protein product [Parascedosporium putredinis]